MGTNDSPSAPHPAMRQSWNKMARDLLLPSQGMASDCCTKIRNEISTRCVLPSMHMHLGIALQLLLSILHMVGPQIGLLIRSILYPDVQDEYVHPHLNSSSLDKFQGKAVPTVKLGY